MQGLFRNPMADPYIVGISPGAALGAVLATVLGVLREFRRALCSAARGVCRWDRGRRWRS